MSEMSRNANCFDLTFRDCKARLVLCTHKQSNQQKDTPILLCATQMNRADEKNTQSPI